MMLADAAARERIARDLDSTLVVEAAAGTGKTTALVGRIVAVVAAGHQGATLGSILSVTFTEKAAGELKLRLRGALEDARGKAPSASAEHQRLERALAELEVAHIGTIHALCSDLLREHPLEAGVDPLFEVATEPEARALLHVAFDRWFEVALRDPPEGIRRVLRRRSKGRDRVTPREQLRRAAWQLVEHRDFTAPWRRDPFDRAAELNAWVPKLRELAALSKRGNEDDYLRKNLDELRRFVEDLDHHEAVAGRDHDGLEASLNELLRHRSWTWTGGKRPYAQDLPRDVVVAQRNAARDELERILLRADADLAACLHQELLPVVDLYRQVKARTGKLDFFDLLLQLRVLLQRDAGVRRALQKRFTHLFVDEFQDTDPLQADILRLLAATDPNEADPEKAVPVPGKLFIVGDPKQSIYRFRRADVALYEHVKRRLLESGASLLDLTTSFRAAPAVQGAVNAAFAPLMRDDTETQVRYVPLTRFREPVSGQPSLIALPVPRPYGKYGRINNYQIEESYPDAAAAFIDFLVRKSGWKVCEAGSAQPLPVQAQHICLLFKRFRGGEGGDVTQRYTAALEARRIPHVLVG
ncbi:MAG: UvrD-helicase domain-containing protein, partial [Myxococcaceae bacterium]